MSERTETAVPLEEARPVADGLVLELGKLCSRIEVAGSIRREKPTVKDVELVAVPKVVPIGFLGETGSTVLELREFASHLGQVTKRGEKYIQVKDVRESGLTLDLFLVTPPSEWGAQLVIRTGPADFSQYLVTRLLHRGWRCHRGRVLDENDELVPTPEEIDFFRACRHRFLLPQERSAWRRS